MARSQKRTSCGACPGSTTDAFKRLHELGLVEPAAASGHAVAAAPKAVTSRSTTPTRTLSSADFEELVASLSRLISAHLGLAGLSLTLALAKAQTFEELALVARRTLEQIQGRQGPRAAATAREALRRLIDD